MTATAQMTADEFLKLPLEPTATRRELVDGEIVVTEPTWKHSAVQGGLYAALRAWSRAAPRRGGASLPVDVLVDDRNVFVPDIVWYRDGRAPQLDDPRPYAVPDLAVEVRSPSTWRYDIGAKKATYERHGVAELWLVDIAADVLLAFRRSHPASATFDVALELGCDDTLMSPLLPGFELAVADVFAG